MKTIVLSGINLYSGGTLSIMKDTLKYLSANLSNKYKIIALVHDKELYKEIKNIEYIEFKDSRDSWFKRIHYE